MAANYTKMSDELRRFYDFAGKVVLFVGAGGRQLLDLKIPVKRLIAIDKDLDALRELKKELAENKLQNPVEVIAAEFEEVSCHGDVVYFEFCLHEMGDPEKALAHAKSLAPDVVVYDHSPGSEWSYYVVEEEKIARSSVAMQRLGIRRREMLGDEQRFANHAELLAKVRTQGPVAVERAERFANDTGIVIPMSFELDLL
ncbi:MAG TPA: hypothetical protein VF135_07200 [Terriglobales bacterium]